MTENRRVTRSKKYSGLGYWIVQIGFSAVLAVLGLVGGIYILIDSGDGDPSGSADTGEGVIVTLVGIAFLLLLVWLVASFVSQSREERARYAWAIMQDYTARNPGLRPMTPGRTVTGDLASMATAAQVRDGELTYEEVLRLQALRPEVPYPGDIDALRRAGDREGVVAGSDDPASLISAEDRARRRARWDADDAEARAELEAARLAPPGAARVVRRTTTAVGWAAIAAFLLSIWIDVPGIGAFMALVGVWCVLRLVTGVLQDARTRRALALVEEWRADPDRAVRGLPTPYAELVREPLGAWWMRLLTPMMLLGIFFIIGGAANIGGAGDPVERGVFIGMATASVALLLASIALRLVAAKRSATQERLLSAYRGPRVVEDLRRSAPRPGSGSGSGSRTGSGS